MKKSVYLFSEGHAGMRDLLGGKGANLAEMSRLGLPVPPGFTLTTAVCIDYLAHQGRLSETVLAEVLQALQIIEAETGRRFGDAQNPLLLSVRSGAKFSMPGMMETILNLGLNDETIAGLIKQTGNERFAYDSYRRLISMFSSVVLDMDKHAFEALLAAEKSSLGVQLDTQLDSNALKKLVAQSLNLVQKNLGRPFPQDPIEQLRLAIEAVFKSWNIPRAVAYRNYHHIDHNLGTAVTVQAMVFGNMGEDSATGVAFTRNPGTGEKGLYGEFLVNAQGEDVVSGIRTPQELADMCIVMPDAYQTLVEISDRLEAHYKDIQDMEFTVEKGRLYILQTRNGKRTIQAAVNIAVDMVAEGIVTREEALLMVDANQLPQLLVPMFDPASKARARESGQLLATGLNASPGAATGKIVFDADEANTLAQQGEAIILVRPETNPDDIHGVLVSRGVLTTRGGYTSHAAVVTRGLGIPCVAGCEAISVDIARCQMRVGDQVFHSGDIVSIDGATGEVFAGRIETMDPTLNTAMTILLDWADRIRKLGVRANADTPEDAAKALELGASGIGLCRTEHMFMAKDRLPIVHRMILADTLEVRQAALAQLLPMQYQDFKAIFTVMQGHPVTIRLLDPPLHEFLPNYETLLDAIIRLKAAHQTGPELAEKEALLERLGMLREVNPMLGLRGCRLGLLYPEIYKMQIKAIFEAACDLIEARMVVIPEVMIPLVGHANELKQLRQDLEGLARAVMSAKCQTVPYTFGTMIELPRAALTADEIAEYADFFSFGTNDLTQTTFGISRDDAERKFLGKYVEQGILADNPFNTVDTHGVGALMTLAIQKARVTHPAIKLGVCGEHGGEAKSIYYFSQLGLDYVSCSPYRIPVARLAAAQAVLMEKQQTVSTLMATV